MTGCMHDADAPRHTLHYFRYWRVLRQGL